jgi:UDP-N-acetylglucosamine 2-epimerase (non-hydrolysing)
MSSRGPVAVVMGTRPEGIKLAPVVLELLRASPVPPLLVATGQHREMLAQALSLFGLTPEIDLSVMTPGQTLNEIASRILTRMRDVLRERRPSCVVVQGDTTTAFAAALAAFYEQIPVAHVEAGLRSGHRYAPFPEEMNRRLVDQLSTVLFAPTARARALLLGEGFAPRDVHVTGNTVVDALLAARAAIRRAPPAIDGLHPGAIEGKRLILVTAHRRESFGAPMRAMCRAMLRIVQAEPDTCIVFPVHMNPNVVDPVYATLAGHPRVALVRPLSYVQFVALLDRAHLVLTDSGGVQEEAPTFAKPVLVMREVTERPEGIEAGVAKLVGTSEWDIAEATVDLLRDRTKYSAMTSGVNPYGDGHAARRIVQVLQVLQVLQQALPAPGLGDGPPARAAAANGPPSSARRGPASSRRTPLHEGAGPESAGSPHG